MNKAFSKDLYNQFNEKGISVALNFLTQQGYELLDRTEAYSSHDCIVQKDGKPSKIEAEVSTSWKTRRFPYQTLNVPYRKRHSQSDLLIRSNFGGTAVAVVPMSIVHQSPIIKKNTCYTTNEPFFDVPAHKIQFYTRTDDGTWVTTAFS